LSTEETDVRAEVVLSAGDAERGFVVLEMEFEREWDAE
jgi:hypothetical protein